MTRHLRILTTLVLVLAQAAPALGATAGQADPDTSNAERLTSPVMAVLPIANYSERSEAHEILLPRVHRGLERAGITFVTSEVLRPLLRKHRIRSLGWIGKDGARTIAELTGAKYLLLGSWDVLRTELDTEIGLSLRVLDIEHMEIVAAVSVGETGSDYTGLLGVGGIYSIGRLADRVVDAAFEELLPLPPYQAPDTATARCNRLALIPMDSFSETPNAGNIMTNLMIAGLVGQGYSVVEPGFVRELGLVRGVAHRGGVDRESAAAIEDTLGACMVVTGAVERFAAASGSPDVSVPSVAFGVRVMSPRTGNIYMMEELEGTGRDGEWMFQRGRTHALIPLANRVFAEFLNDLNKNNREDVSYDQVRR